MCSCCALLYYTILYCTYVQCVYAVLLCTFLTIFTFLSFLHLLYDRPSCTSCTLMHSLTSSITQPCNNDIHSHARVRTRPTTRTRCNLLSSPGKLLVTLRMQFLVHILKPAGLPYHEQELHGISIPNRLHSQCSVLCLHAHACTSWPHSLTEFSTPQPIAAPA